jgi:hypothetical protein
MTSSITITHLPSTQSITPDGQYDETWGRSLGDYAQGQRTRRNHPFVQTDFATGMRTATKSTVIGEFATGMRVSNTPTHIGDFATGMRTQPGRVSHSHGRLNERRSLLIAA